MTRRTLPAAAALAAALPLALLAAACGDAWRDDPEPPPTPAPTAAGQPLAPSPTPSPTATATPTPTATPTATPARAATPTAAPQATAAPTPRAPLLDTFGNGEYRVGIDIAPGRYRTTTASGDCSWTITSDNYAFWGWYAVIEIRADVNQFATEECGTWSPDLTPIATPGQPFGDGTFVVGLDIAPGRYRSTSPTGDCGWELLPDFTGIRPSIIGEFPGAAPTIADVSPETAGFHSGGCGVWSADLTPIVTPGQSFGDGAFLVGSEIAPGRYRSASQGSCMWERRSGFGGSTFHAGFRVGGDLLGDSTYDGWLPQGAQTIVDIAPNDTGFLSDGCGTWTTDLSPIVAPGEPFGDGAFLVGPEIAPGLYRTDSGRSCTWVRLTGFGGQEADVAARSPGRQPDVVVADLNAAIVKIEETDAGFLSGNCGWSRLMPRSASGEPFGEGLFLVGSGIAPGRYRAAPPVPRCDWRRLDGVGGVVDSMSLIRRSSVTVDIAPTDTGFYSRGCGEWTPAPPAP